MLLMELIIDRIEIYHIICLMFIYIITILKYAPVENENKRLSDKTKALNRKKSIVLSLFWLLIAIGLYSWSHALSLIIVFTLILVTIFILIVEFRKEGQA
jgi:accessory gene regulator protein AgrB